MKNFVKMHSELWMKNFYDVQSSFSYLYKCIENVEWKNIKTGNKTAKYKILKNCNLCLIFMAINKKRKKVGKGDNTWHHTDI